MRMIIVALVRNKSVPKMMHRAVPDMPDVMAKTMMKRRHVV
jgi:hypothetical protein